MSAIFDSLHGNERVKNANICLQSCGEKPDGSLTLSCFAPSEKNAQRILEQVSGRQITLTYLGSKQTRVSAIPWTRYHVCEDGKTVTITVEHGSGDTILHANVVKENQRGVSVEVTAESYCGAVLATLHVTDVQVELMEPVMDRLVRDSTACAEYAKYGDDLFTRIKI